MDDGRKADAPFRSKNAGVSYRVAPQLWNYLQVIPADTAFVTNSAVQFEVSDINAVPDPAVAL